MKLKPRTTTAPLLCDLTGEMGENQLHTLSIGAKRDVLMLSVAAPVQGNGSALRDKNHTHRFTLHHWHSGKISKVVLPPTQQAYYSVQPLGDKWLCVANRCFPDENNAHIFDRNGDLLRCWHVGDGVEDVQVAPNGEVWVSYFDEGVFGDTPLSREGLNCFDAMGTAKFGFLTDTTGGAGEIVDCYALNVASNRDVWLLFYTDFPLVHLREHKIQAIYQPPPEMRGSHALAVCDSRRLFVGGYEFKNKVFWRDEASKRQIELKIVDAEGKPLNWTYARGRGADLLLCDGPKVWILSLNEIGV